MTEGNRITAAVFRGTEDAASLETLDAAGLRDDEVLVRIVAAGICHTDLTCRSGFMALPRPVVLGHEGAGIVQAVGAGVRDLEPGDKVVLTFMSCGTCPSCRRGSPAYCRHFLAANMSGRRLDGSTALADAEGGVAGHFYGQSSFATHSVANARNAIKLRADADLRLVAPLGCGVQTGAGAVMNVLRPEAGESIVVFGAGGVGLSAVMAARVLRCDPILVVEPRAARRDLALELGATQVIDPVTEDVAARLALLAQGDLNHAVDTSGIPDVIGLAIGALAPRGRIALITANALEAVLPVSLMQLALGGISLHGVCMGGAVPASFLPRLVDLVMDGSFPMEKLVRFYEFADIDRALDDQHHGRAVKPVLLMPQPTGAP